MDNLNYVFFEEYKSLDKLCKEIYGDDIGVTNYIDDMKTVSYIEYVGINNWKNDLDQLIRMRYIRNDLAHTEGAFGEQICTQMDIDWIKDFHRRIMKQTDPLAVLNLKNKSSNKMQIPNKGSIYVRNSVPDINECKNTNIWMKQPIEEPFKQMQREPVKKSIDNLEKKKSHSILELIYYVLVVAIVIMIIIMAYFLCVEFLI